MSSAVGAVAALVFALVVTGYFVQSRLPPPKPRIIGIDLGTTFSCVATYESKSGAVQIYKDSSNRSIIPSVVAVLDDGSVLVGQSAVDQIELNPTQTIYDAKRFIGRRFEEAEISAAQKKYPFKIRLDNDGHARFEVSSSNGSQSLTPEDIGAHILRTLKRAVERSIDRPVTATVLSVPADFNAAQRNATVRAATLAGLKVLRVINEPTAAALAYGLHKKASTSTVIVIDFGGGTLDVSMLLIQGGMFVTVAMAGNNRLGGQDVNQNLMEFFSEHIREKFGDGPRSARDLQIVRDAAEKVKIALTDDTSATFRVELHDVVGTAMRLNRPITFEYEMTRSEFESVNAEIFRKFVKPIERVLSDAEIRAEDVDEIVLVGGSTRIPRVRAITAELFGKPPHTAIDPDVAVVTGVAVQANIAGNGWPLKVSAVEIQRDEGVKKVDVSGES